MLIYIFLTFLLTSHVMLVLTQRVQECLLWRLKLAHGKLIGPGPATFQSPYITEVIQWISLSRHNLPEILVHTSMDNFRK